VFWRVSKQWHRVVACGFAFGFGGACGFAFGAASRWHCRRQMLGPSFSLSMIVNLGAR
jgi:hypothetical protein